MRIPWELLIASPLNDDHFVRPSFLLVSHFYMNISLFFFLASISHLGNAAFLRPRYAMRTHLWFLEKMNWENHYRFLITDLCQFWTVQFFNESCHLNTTSMWTDVFHSYWAMIEIFKWNVCCCFFHNLFEWVYLFYHELWLSIFISEILLISFYIWVFDWRFSRYTNNIICFKWKP